MASLVSTHAPALVIGRGALGEERADLREVGHRELDVQQVADELVGDPPHGRRDHDVLAALPAEQRKRMTNFVFLEPSDKMPPRTGGQKRNLSARFLDTALTEERLTGFKRSTDLLSFMRLRNSNQFDFIQ